VEAQEPGSRPWYRFFGSLAEAERFMDAECADATTKVTRRMVFPWVTA